MKHAVQIFVLSVLLLTVAHISTAHADTHVDLKLSLLQDDSGSVFPSEFSAFKIAYANVFLDPDVLNAVTHGPTGSIAVKLSYFGINTRSIVGWSLIHDTASATAFHDAVMLSVQRGGVNYTGFALNGAVSSFSGSGFTSTRNIIDLSTDAPSNSTDPDSVPGARDNAASHGITVNAMAFGDSTVVNWLTDNAVTPDGFVVQARNVSEISSTLRKKILTEVASPIVTPEPPSWSLFVIGLAAFGFVVVRKKFRIC